MAGSVYEAVLGLYKDSVITEETIMGLGSWYCLYNKKYDYAISSFHGRLHVRKFGKLDYIFF